MSSGPDRPIVVAGSISIDRNLVDGRCFHKLGGVPVYAGLTYARAGLPTILVANAAGTDIGRFDEIAAAGLQTRWGPSPGTTRFENRMVGGLREQRVSSLARTISWGDMRPAAERAAWVHLGPLHPGDFDAEVFERLIRVSARVVLDLQGLVREIRSGHVVPTPSPLLPRALQATEIVKGSTAETEVVARAFGAPVDDLMERFAIAEWVATAGARGGRVHVRGREPVSYPAHSAEPLDPTGAGDVFLAAYATARLWMNVPVDEAARRAAAVAARQISGRHIPFPLLQPPDLMR